MAKWLWALAALVALAAPAAANEKWSGRVPKVRVPAWDSILVGGRVIVIDDGFRTASAWDAKTGKRLWQTKVQDGARGRQTLRAAGGAVVWWAGDKMHRLDPATGKRLGSADTMLNHDCGLREVGGACAMSCECATVLVACDSGKKLGRVYRGEYVEEVDPDGQMSSFCGGRGDLLASAGGAAVLQVHRDDSPYGTMKVGVDVKTGKELWRSKQWGDDSFVLSGQSGGVCYLGELDGDLDVIECATGKLLWKRGAPQGLKRLARHLVLPTTAGLYRFIEGEATMHDARTGRILWRRKLKDTWVLPLGVFIEDYLVRFSEDAGTLGFVDLAGKPAGSVKVDQHASVYRDPGGGLYITGKDIIAIDAAGRERGRLPADPPNPAPGADFLGLFSGDRLRLLARADFRELADLPGSWGVVTRAAGAILLYRYGKDKVGEAVLVTAP